MCVQQQPLLLREPEYLERLRQRIDQPSVSDLVPGVDGQLVSPVRGGSGWREHFADPVRRQLERGNFRHFWHALAAPTGEVGYEDILCKMQLRFEQDHPSAGTRVAAAERVELTTQNIRCLCVRRS